MMIEASENTCERSGNNHVITPARTHTLTLTLTHTQSHKISKATNADVANSIHIIRITMPYNIPNTYPNQPEP